MNFASLEFALFLPIVFLLYWFVFNRNLRIQNLFIVVASYVFYGWWDWRFLLLIIITSFCNWGSGLLMQYIENKELTPPPAKFAKAVLISNILLNLGILALFKYYNFFIENFIFAFASVGIHLQPTTLHIILPVGISFYTFQALSYSIDVYKKKIEPTKDIVGFFAFICFFPQLMAGPIERATRFLPQFYVKRNFDYAKGIDGMKQILWGLFKKVVMANTCATIVNEIFENTAGYSGSNLALGVVFFAFQLYCDFSGYSDIAIGTARLFGFSLTQNFNYPYFATSFADYWKRNHISLTQWFMDYVYYPLIGKSDSRTYWNFCMIITFLLSGLWHGAGWTFVLWGLYQGIFIVISMNSQKRRKRFEKNYGLKNNAFYNIGQILLTFGIVCFGLIFFRAESVNDAFIYISGMFSLSLFTIPVISGYKTIMILIAFFLFMEWIGKERKYAIENLCFIKKRYLRLVFYYIISFAILAFIGEEQEFIYFQF
jgi:D-alanyl-lipoteichoic acid acyltransferase DltB (MBOAT superfamily)